MYHKNLMFCLVVSNANPNAKTPTPTPTPTNTDTDTDTRNCLNYLGVISYDFPMIWYGPKSLGDIFENFGRQL